MSDQYLYRLGVPEQSQTRTQSQLQRQLSRLAGLDGASTVEDLGVDPGDRVLEGQYRGRYAGIMAQEMEELFGADYGPVPFYAPDGSPVDGYFELSNINVGRFDPRSGGVHEFDGVLTKEGTRESHRRALRCRPQEVHRNDYGNTKEALVAVPSSASRRVWYQRETQQREPVTVASSVDVEGADGAMSVDLVDAYAVGLSAPFELVYDVDYETSGAVDVVLWDDHDRAKYDEDGVNSWQWVFSPSHEYAGVPVVDTGRLRLRLDTSGGLTAMEYRTEGYGAKGYGTLAYGDAVGDWTSMSLPSSDWELWDVDITTITPVKIQAQVVFRDPTQSPPGEYALDLVARRGRDRVHWLVPSSVDDVTPTGLQSLLDPIADPAVVRGQESLGLIDRGETRR